MAVPYKCCSFSSDLRIDEYHDELARGVESWIGLYATDDDGTTEPYVTTRLGELTIEYCDEAVYSLIPWQMSREADVPWGLGCLVRRWYATLVRGERIMGRSFRAVYRIEVDN